MTRRKQNRGWGGKPSLFSYYNEAVWPNGILITGTEATPVYEVWELYDKGVLVSGSPERLPLARGFHFDFLPLPTLLEALGAALGNNATVWFQTTLAIVDDGGASGEAEAAGAGEDEVYATGYDFIISGDASSTYPSAMAVTKWETGMRPEVMKEPAMQYPLSDALSVMVQCKAYPAIDAAILQAAIGVWTGGYFLEWKPMSTAAIGNQLLAKAME